MKKVAYCIYIVILGFIVYGCSSKTESAQELSVDSIAVAAPDSTDTNHTDYPEYGIDNQATAQTNKSSNKNRKKVELIDGTTSFVLPSSMKVDTNYMSYLGISTNITYNELSNYLENTLYSDNPQFKKTNDSLILSKGGKEKIKVYPYMKATFRDVTLDSDNFDITEITPQWQEILNNEDSVYFWRWNITPKREGNFRLQFNLYGSTEYNPYENDIGKHILLFNKTIEVTAYKVPISKIDAFFNAFKQINDYWQILTSGLIGIILFFFRDKIIDYFKKDKK